MPKTTKVRHILWLHKEKVKFALDRFLPQVRLFIHKVIQFGQMELIFVLH
jgi:hypothetical protein